MIVGITQTFSAAHHLPYYEGNCRNLHGHTWKAEIQIDSKTNPETGMVIDFRTIKNVVNDLDHSHLNDVLENPTCEHVAEHLINKMSEHITDGMITLKLYESETSWCKLTRYSTA